jgi:lysozyme
MVDSAGIEKVIERLERIERKLEKNDRRQRRDLGLLASQAALTDFAVTAMLCGACVGVVGIVWAGVQIRESAKENLPGWVYNAIWGWADGSLSTNVVGGSYASPIVGKSLQDLVNYQPAHGQSFGPETGNQRSYGPHGGIDFDCRVGGCAGADVAAPISGQVSAIEQIATSANDASYRLKIVGTDWKGTVEHRLVHVDSIKVQRGDNVKAGQVVAKVSPTDSVSTGPHLDWKIQRNGQWENPQKWAKEAMNQGSVNAISTDTIDLIKSFEGFHPSPYWDYQQWTNGFGTKAKSKTEVIDEATAEQRLKSYLDRNCLPAISSMALDAGKVSALASFCYNVGPAQFKNSETYKYAKAGNHQSAANALLNWTKADGKVLPGLVRRRQKERTVYLGG